MSDYNPYKYRCYLYSISRSYYNYMKTMNDLYESGFVGDLAEIGFAEPVRIYSNVEGGNRYFRRRLFGVQGVYK